MRTADPLKLAEFLWPHVTFYDRQKEIIRSVWQNDRTVVPAGHKLGKSFVAAATILLFFLTRHPCRIVTTSVDQTQLEGVLWGEIRRFVQSSAYPLEVERGGPLVVNHLHLRKVSEGKVCGISYCLGRVAARGEGMSGHHVAKTGDGIPRTLFVADESSGIDELAFSKASEWHDRALILGNPYECQNPFKWAVKGKPGTNDRGGDQPRNGRDGFSRRVIKIDALSSPNVAFALAQQRAGKTPTADVLISGVLSWEDYQDRRLTWDVVKQCVGLGAEFWEGAEVLLFPPAWLNHSETLALSLAGQKREAISIGVDPGEGEAETAMCAVDRLGVIEERAIRTPDTSVIPGDALAFAERHNVPDEQILFDAGGGGKQHAHVLRSKGHNVRVVAFGEAVVAQARRGRRGPTARQDEREEKQAFANRRAQMYGELRDLIDPSGENGGFAIPARCVELRRQLAPIPLTRDGEGKLFLLPKNKKDPKSKQKTLVEIIGCSPDRADALVLAVHGMLHPQRRAIAGAIR